MPYTALTWEEGVTHTHTYPMKLSSSTRYSGTAYITGYSLRCIAVPNST